MGQMAGRPREFDRDLALRRMQAVFWERGYDETSLADLVEATALASARLYAAFGTKQAMFRECIDLYEREEGGFADRALAEESTVHAAITRLFRDAAAVYSTPKPRGCMVVSAATSCASADSALRDWLRSHRQARTTSIIQRIRQAVAAGELADDTDARAVGDALAALLHGMSIQARDGVAQRRLINSITPALSMLPAASANSLAQHPSTAGNRRR